MKMLSHNRLQTNRQTDRVSDQLLELLEWLFATKKVFVKLACSGWFSEDFPF